MDPDLKKILKAASLDLRHTLEGKYDERGEFHPGDLEHRLNALGVWRDRPAKPLTELPYLPDEDKEARRVVDAYIAFRAEAGVGQGDAVAEFVRESAYTWANRLLCLRCMEARSIIDEVILQKEVYGWRSMVHNRLGRQDPTLLVTPDEGLFAVLSREFELRARELPGLFDPKTPAIALRPSLAALKRCIGLLSGTEKAGSNDPATDDVFAAPDALGWAYQYWNAEEKDRVFEKVRTEQGAKIEGADIIPATQLYTEPYMVKFLVQNSLGALWLGMYPDSDLADNWEYYVRDADRAPVERKRVEEITFLDPACGSGHFHLEAFDLLYAMYEEEGELNEPEIICAAILNHNLYGVDIDERAVQIAQAALWMKAKEFAWDLEPEALTNFHHHFVATNIRLPRGKDHLEAFLKKHPEDLPLRPALETVFEGLANAHELGSLLQLEEPVEKELRFLKGKQEELLSEPQQPYLIAEAKPAYEASELPLGVEGYEVWKEQILGQLRDDFEAEAEAADLTQAFFGQSAGKGLALFDILARRYDVVTANPPYMGSKNMGGTVKSYVASQYEPGKRDLYATFIIRCLALANRCGRIAMVTRNSWLSLKYYEELRHSDDASKTSILSSHRVECLADIGPHGFSEVGGEIVNAVMFCLAHDSSLSDEAFIYAIRLVNAGNPSDKDELLKASVSTRAVAVTLPRQAAFRNAPLNQILYWLPDGFIEAFTRSDLLHSKAVVREGIHTSSSNRFVRYSWECPPNSNQRWVKYVKGGGYRKWLGLEYYRCEWEFSGSRIKATGKAIIPSEDLYFTCGFTYSKVGGSAFSSRLMNNAIFSDAGQAIFPVGNDEVISFLNTRLASYFLRLISPTLDFNKGYVELCPIPKFAGFWTGVTSSIASLKAPVLATQIESDHFRVTTGNGLTSRILDYCCTNLLRSYALTSYVLWVEACLETYWADMLGLSHNEVTLCYREVGKPSGAFPLLTGYDNFAEPMKLPDLANRSAGFLSTAPRVDLSIGEISEIRQNLRALFAAGPGANIDQLEPGHDESHDDSFGNRALAPVPAEYYIEELSIRLQLNPLSINLLLREGIENANWRCPPEERRLAEDLFTLMVLRLLGHQWPKELEAKEPVPMWADQDGVIPISSGGHGEATLYDRVRERIADEFPNGTTNNIEREFADIVGQPLAEWLSGSFFARHISQFKKRPVAWQLETTTSGRGRGRPAFSCLVYYHRLNADLLPNVRSQYIRDLRRGYETEQRTLRQTTNRTAIQDARLLQLDAWLDELNAFVEKLEQVSVSGFGDTPALQVQLRQYAIDDGMQSLKAAWLRRLAGVVASSPLRDWQTRAGNIGIHPELGDWIAASMDNLNHHCASVGAKSPQASKLNSDPDARALAAVIGTQAAQMVEKSISLACDVWFDDLNSHVLRPMLDEINELKAQVAEQEARLAELNAHDTRARYNTEQAIKSLKARVRKLTKERNAQRKKAKGLREHIEGWTFPQADGWTEWLGMQPMFDQIASSDGQRPPPRTIADFVAQESRYDPDINDGVRVNIAPLQKAGLLAADVLAAKDVDKAIADRADWRADERRWCREGKLPRPGWWNGNFEDWMDWA